MKKIYKYLIRGVGINNVDMPKESKILSVKCIDGYLYIWAIVDILNENETRSFFVAATGQEVTMFCMWEYLGTVKDDDYIWHVFYQ